MIKTTTAINRWWKIFNQWLTDASNLALPRMCEICRHRLLYNESCLCNSCYAQLPFTHMQGKPGNVVEKLFWKQFPIVRASAFLHYQPGAPYTQAIMALKYHHRPQVGVFFGERMAEDLLETDFFEGIDFLIPVPLAQDRLRKRGYNQSETLARGIEKVTGIPVCTDAVTRSISNPSQTHLGATERKENVKGIFTLNPNHQLDHCHVLLIDDILTTGATLISCAQTLAQTEDIRISVLTLGLAGTHTNILNNKEEDGDNSFATQLDTEDEKHLTP